MSRHLNDLIGTLAAGRTPVADWRPAAHLLKAVAVGVFIQVGAGIGCSGEAGGEVNKLMYFLHNSADIDMKLNIKRLRRKSCSCGL